MQWTFDKRDRITHETDDLYQNGVNTAVANFNWGISQYAANANVVTWNDSLMGSWTYGYDTLNRLTSASSSVGSYAGVGVGWSYDAWGNRTAETVSGSSALPIPISSQTQFNVQNGVSVSTYASGGFVYDAAGNVSNDGVNQYLYDGDGRLCAIRDTTLYKITEYVYDAEGHRVAKGTPNAFNCNFAGNGFAATSRYVIGLDGEQLSEITGAGAWSHTNVFGPNGLLATYSGSSVYFALNNWLGTKRLTVDENGLNGTKYNSFPFGNAQYTGGSFDPSELHFTGKERDTESGLDYFGARYYASNMGRFMSPDPIGGDLTNPQSLNRYAYVLNNPLTNTDPIGLYTCTDSSDCSSKKDVALEKTLAGLRGSSNADVARAAGAYGAVNNDNGVSVGFKDLSGSGKGGDTVSTIGTDASGNLRANSAITISSKDSGTNFTADVGHEGSHAADAQDVVRSGLTGDDKVINAGMNITPYQSEVRAYGVTNFILNSANESRNYSCGSGGCPLGRGVNAGDIQGNIDRLLSGNHIYDQGGRPMSSSNQGPSVVNGVTPKATVPSVPH